MPQKKDMVQLALSEWSTVLEQYTVISSWGVTPKKYISIPRLELIAAMLSVKMAMFLRKELNIDCSQETFWSDSKVVLGYIRNTTKKFKIFVANRIQQIHENSEVN